MLFEFEQPFVVDSSVVVSTFGESAGRRHSCHGGVVPGGSPPPGYG